MGGNSNEYTFEGVNGIWCINDPAQAEYWRNSLRRSNKRRHTKMRKITSFFESDKSFEQFVSYLTDDENWNIFSRSIIGALQEVKDAPRQNKVDALKGLIKTTASYTDPNYKTAFLPHAV